MMRRDDDRFNMSVRVMVANMLLPVLNACFSRDVRTNPNIDQKDLDEVYQSRKKTILNAGINALMEFYNGQEQTRPNILNLNMAELTEIETQLVNRQKQWEAGQSNYKADIVMGNPFNPLTIHLQIHACFLAHHRLITEPERRLNPEDMAIIAWQDEIRKTADRLAKTLVLNFLSGKEEGLDIIRAELTGDEEHDRLLALCFCDAFAAENPVIQIGTRKLQERLSFQRDFERAADQDTTLTPRLSDTIFEIFYAVAKQEPAEPRKIEDALIRKVKEQLDKYAEVRVHIILMGMVVAHVADYHSNIRGGNFDRQYFFTQMDTLNPPGSEPPKPPRPEEP
ncbi:MAG: hypothetical protein L6Q57_02925 [Alphaproteobacteria bacterium]|nr:hypothetical protein [Alphaproteobacteria bacterium]